MQDPSLQGELHMRGFLLFIVRWVALDVAVQAVRLKETSKFDLRLGVEGSRWNNVLKILESESSHIQSTIESESAATQTPNSPLVWHTIPTATDSQSPLSQKILEPHELPHSSRAPSGTAGTQESNVPNEPTQRSLGTPMFVSLNSP